MNWRLCALNTAICCVLHDNKVLPAPKKHTCGGNKYAITETGVAISRFGLVCVGIGAYIIRLDGYRIRFRMADLWRGNRDGTARCNWFDFNEYRAMKKELLCCTQEFFLCY